MSQAPECDAHVRPVFAVVCDGVLCSTSSTTARKTGRLARDGRCTLATSTDDMDLVYEGVATPVVDVDRARRIADAYHDKYGWPVEVDRRRDLRRAVRGAVGGTTAVRRRTRSRR